MSSPTTGEYDYRQVSPPMFQAGNNSTFYQLIRYIRKEPDGTYSAYTEMHVFPMSRFVQGAYYKPGLVSEDEYYDYFDQTGQELQQKFKSGALAGVLHTNGHQT